MRRLPVRLRSRGRLVPSQFRLGRGDHRCQCALAVVRIDSAARSDAGEQLVVRGARDHCAQRLADPAHIGRPNRADGLCRRNVWTSRGCGSAGPKTIRLKPRGVADHCCRPNLFGCAARAALKARRALWAEYAGFHRESDVNTRSRTLKRFGQ